MQNFTDIQAAGEAGVDTSRIKVFSIGVLGALLAGVLGYLLNRYITNLDNAWQTILYVVVPAIGFLAVFLLQVLFVKSRNLINGFILLESIAITVPFLSIFSWWLIFAWLLLFMFFWKAAQNGKEALENQIKIRFFQVERVVIPGALTALSLFISIAYINFFFEGGMLSKKSFQTLLRPVVPAMAVYVPGFSWDMTMGKLAEFIAVSQLGGQAELIPASQLSFATSQVISYLRAEAAPYGLTFKTSDTLIDVLYNYTAQKMNQIPKSLQSLLPIGFALLLFLIVKGFAILIRWIAAPPAYLLYQLSLATGFARLALESRSREVIVLR
jgi:hypothetical protein